MQTKKMKVLVIGANGKVGRLAVKQLKSREGIEPYALIRDSSQAIFFNDLSVSSLVKDLTESQESLQQSIADFDAVIFTAGSGGKTGADKTLEIDLDAAAKCIESAEKANVQKFVMVSAAYADDRSFWESSSIKPYYIAKHYADYVLKKSSLNYSILRPVALTDDGGSGEFKIKSSNSEPLGKSVSREDVAQMICDSLTDPAMNRRVIEFSN